MHSKIHSCKYEGHRDHAYQLVIRERMRQLLPRTPPNPDYFCGSRNKRKKKDRGRTVQHGRSGWILIKERLFIISETHLFRACLKWWWIFVQDQPHDDIIALNIVSFTGQSKCTYWARSNAAMILPCAFAFRPFFRGGNSSMHFLDAGYYSRFLLMRSNSALITSWPLQCVFR